MDTTVVALCLSLACGSLLGSAHARTPSIALAEALSLTPDAVRGGAIYAQACASCHRADGAGRPGGEMPALADHLSHLPHQPAEK